MKFNPKIDLDNVSNNDTILPNNLEGLEVEELINLFEVIDKKLKTTLPGYSGCLTKN